eukprot:401305_1
MRVRDLKAYIQRNRFLLVNPAVASKLYHFVDKNDLRYMALDCNPLGWTKQIVSNLPQQLRRHFIEDKIKQCMDILHEKFDVSKFVKYIQLANTDTKQDITLIIDEIMSILKRSNQYPALIDSLTVTGFIRNIRNIEQIPLEMIDMCFYYFHVEQMSQLIRKRRNAKKSELLNETFEVENKIAWQICTSYRYPQPTDLLEEILRSWTSKTKTFKCIIDEIMHEVIKFDLVDIARKIIGNKWHKINEKDELQAQLTNGKCHRLFIEISTFVEFEDYLVDDSDSDSW